MQETCGFLIKKYNFSPLKGTFLLNFRGKKASNKYPYIYAYSAAQSTSKKKTNLKLIFNIIFYLSVVPKRRKKNTTPSVASYIF